MEKKNDDKLVKTAIYDLQGRRLNARPQRGLYIQGGKMRMAW